MSQPNDDEGAAPDYLGGASDDVPEQLPGEAAPLGTSANVPVDAHLDLPPDGTPLGGLYMTNVSARLFGTARTISVIRKTGAAWAGMHPGFDIGIGDISKRGGGPLPGHASHRKGIDFDVRLMRTDGRRSGVTIHDAAYSSDLTGKLIALFVANGIAVVTHVFFNDPALRKPPVQPWPHHDNHFHVRLAAG